MSCIDSFGKFVLVAVSSLIFGGCEPRYHEVVENACIRDGEPMGYCRCTARGMKIELGYKGYAVFSDLILLSDTNDASSDAIIELMEKHALTPADLTQIRGNIDRATRAVQAGCRAG